MLTKKRIGILRGGTGKHYAPSITKGGDLLAHIQEHLNEKYKPVDIFVDKDHVWHFGGVPVAPSDLVHKIDIVWNVSHPGLSNILDSLSIPHVTTPHFSSALASSREMLREHVKQIGLPMPRHLVIPLYQEDFDGPREKYAIKKAKEVHAKFAAPWIVKSYTEDTNMGIHLAKTFPELVDAIEDGVNHEKSILVEEFITGKVASLHSVPEFRGEKVYIFPLGNTFGDFTREEKEKLVDTVRSLHDHLGVRHYLKSDFVVNPRGGVYLLSIDSMPDIKQGSHFSQVCESIGAKVHHVVEHILERVNANN